MTSKPAHLRALAEMIAAEDREDYDAAEIVCDKTCYLGYRRISRRTVNRLLGMAAVKFDDHGGAQHYTVNGLGRSINRRPELAEEVALWIMAGKGSFTIRDDQIVPI